MFIKDLRDKEFIGKIVPVDAEYYYDERLRGRYYVHIPELMPSLGYDQGILCSNHVHSWRITPSDVGEYGQYWPLHAGTYVIVKFWENDTNTGQITKILSDYKDERDLEPQDCTTVIPAVTDRDEKYIIFKTPKNFNIFYVNEETTNEPNTIYLIYNRDDSPKRRTVFRINEDGVHFWTRDNNRVRIGLDEDIQIDGNKNEKVKGEVKIEVTGTVSVKSDSNINVDAGPNINLNCGMATTANEVKDLGPEETSEYQSGVGGTCDDATDEFNSNKKRDNETME